MMFKKDKYDKDAEAKKTLAKIKEQKYASTEEEKQRAREYLANEAKKKAKIDKFNKFLGIIFFPIPLGVKAMDALERWLDKKHEDISDFIIRILLGIIYLLEISAYVALVLMIAHWLMK